jgi:apolipoprotein N-acyltransferase
MISTLNIRCLYSHGLYGSAGALISLIAWLPLNLEPQLLAVALLPALWMLANMRSYAFMAVLSYYIIIGRDVPAAITQFGDISKLISWSITLAYCVVVALIWSVCWHADTIKRMLGLTIAILVTSIPPLGGFITGSPLLAAGWLFPGTGLMGICLLSTIWLLWGATLQKKSIGAKTATSWCVAGISTLWIVSIVINLNYRQPVASQVLGISTQLPLYPQDLESQYQRQLQLTELAFKALNQDATIVALPEEIGGFWQPRFAWMWADVDAAYTKANKTLIVGFDTKPDKYANTAIFMGIQPNERQTVYAKVPAPIGGWKPWSDIHAPARWMISSLVEVQGQKLAIFFCWEELVPWPWLATATMASQEQLHAVVLVNHWFAKSLDIGHNQNRSSLAWTRLFGWSHSRVVNFPLDK